MPADPFNIPGVGARRAELDPKTLRTSSVQAKTPEGTSFKDVLTETVNEVQRLETEADHTIKQLVAGEIKALANIPGVGPKTLEKFGNVGIERVQDLIGFKSEELAEKTGISLKKISAWKKAAKAAAKEL